MLAHSLRIVAVAVLAHAVPAQCYTQSGTVVTLNPLFGQSADDDGLSDAIALGFTFPMVGAPVTITHCQIDANGLLYLTDASGVVGPAQHGISGSFEMRGYPTADASARVVAVGGDLMAGSGGNWAVTADTSVPGQFKVCWHDMSRYVFSGPTGSFNFSITLHDTGIIEFAYDDEPIVDADSRTYVGVSVGNSVGASTSVDLTEGADSGSLGLLYENSWPPIDLEARGIRFTPNGLGGFTAGPYCLPGRHESFGEGCYTYEEPHQAIYAHFPDAATAAAALEGESVTFTPNFDGYIVTWGGGTYVAPSPSASVVVIGDDVEADLTPSIPFPHLGTPVPTLSVCTNGYVNMGPVLNNDVDDYGSPWNLLNQNIASFRSNTDYDANIGSIKSEEVVIGPDTVLIVTWENVERFFGGTNPDRFQFQLNLTTGVVTLVWDAMATTGTSDLVVGYAPGGPSVDAGPIDLSTALPITTYPDVYIHPLSLSATGLGINDGVNDSVVTYTIDNIPESAPSSGQHLGFVAFSVLPTSPIDLGVIGMPGCDLLLQTFTLVHTLPPSPISTAATTFTFTPGLANPGFNLYCQALAVFAPASLANGQNALGVVTSNRIRTVVGSY